MRQKVSKHISRRILYSFHLSIAYYRYLTQFKLMNCYSNRQAPPMFIKCCTCSLCLSSQNRQVTKRVEIVLLSCCIILLAVLSRALSALTLFVPMLIIFSSNICTSTHKLCNFWKGKAVIFDNILLQNLLRLSFAKFNANSILPGDL